MVFPDECRGYRALLQGHGILHKQPIGFVPHESAGFNIHSANWHPDDIPDLTILIIQCALSPPSWTSMLSNGSPLGSADRDVDASPAGLPPPCGRTSSFINVLSSISDMAFSCTPSAAANTSLNKFAPRLLPSTCRGSHPICSTGSSAAYAASHSSSDVSRSSPYSTTHHVRGRTPDLLATYLSMVQ